VARRWTGLYSPLAPGTVASEGQRGKPMPSTNFTVAEMDADLKRFIVCASPCQPELPGASHRLPKSALVATYEDTHVLTATV